MAAKKAAKARKAAKRAVKRHRGPSAASLRAAPEIPEGEEVFHGRGVEGLRKAIAWARGRRGRPKKGEAAQGSSTRSIRLPDPTWAALEAAAKKRGVTLHVLLKQGITEFLAEAAAARRRRRA